jgi:hypothetical protein
LTDEDLFTLFPHEGVQGSNIVQAAQTFFAPDYSRSVTFRLGRSSFYLYADYQDSEGVSKTLACDLRTKGWQPDVYASAVSVHLGIVQQESSLTAAASLYPVLAMSNGIGQFLTQSGSTDAGGNISWGFAGFEWEKLAEGMIYFHLPWIDVVYLGGPVTLTVASLGGESPIPVTLPLAAAFVRVRIFLTENKGTAYRVSVAASAFAQVFINDWVASCGAWARSSPYAPVRILDGGKVG